MRIHAPWMKSPDPFILEYLNEEGLSSPSEISEDDRIYFQRSWINKRLKALEGYGMVQNRGNGMYAITQEGQAWLVGEFDPRPEGNKSEASA